MFCYLIPHELCPKELNLGGSIVTANVNSNIVANAIDGNIKTRWDTGGPMKKGMYYEINLNKNHMVNRLVMDTSISPGGYPREFSVWYSEDNINWFKVFGGNQTNNLVITNMYFESVLCKYIKIVIEKDDNVDWWSIHELKIWGR